LQANSRSAIQQRDQLQRQVVDYQDLIMLIEDDIKNNTLKDELKKQKHPLPMTSPTS
jgi:hypothetical protein